jgi:hypothetical protein
MTALSIPAALAVALHCAPAEDPGMLVGIARQESGLETLTLHDDTSGEVLHGAGVIDAARRLILAGHSVDLGAWQINSRNLPLLGLAVADAFEPCKAVSAAARLIELFSRYNTGSPSRGIGTSALLGHRYPTSWTKHERARLAASPLCSDGCLSSRPPSGIAGRCQEPTFTGPLSTAAVDPKQARSLCGTNRS